MKYKLKWDQSEFFFRCWECNKILFSISTQGNSIIFESNAECLEINCPFCGTNCGYDLNSVNDNMLIAHDWDAEIDKFKFEGEIGRRNRNIVKKYKELLIKDEKLKKIYKKEFEIIVEYFEYLSDEEIDGSQKDINAIESFLEEIKSYENISKDREVLIKKAIDRVYSMLSES